MVKDNSGDVDLENLPNPGDQYTLGNIIGAGVSSTVYEATDNQSNGLKVAVKIQKLTQEFASDIQEEYSILKNVPEHINLPTFYGAYRKENDIWFVMELCSGGSVIDLVKGLILHNRHLSEEQAAFILKETVQALCHLHRNHIVHRDIKGSNILLTANGGIKIVDFGISRKLKSTLDKRNTSVGSPCWMAPEMIANQNPGEPLSYDNKIDVWALGITALEIAEGKAPFEDIHPSRAIFQIVRNPPPTFSTPSRWSQLYIDFVSECLTKTPEERPFIFEFEEHPFLTSLPGKDFHLGTELVELKKTINASLPVSLELQIRKGGLQRKCTEPIDSLIVEDLAALDNVTEETILYTVKERFERDMYYTYLGDILLFINPNKELNIFGDKHHKKYFYSSRASNTPHVYSVADGAYQDMMHHSEAQHIILNGEAGSGKTTNYIHLLDHLLHLGGNGIKLGDKIRSATKVIQAFGNAATPHNGNSTRHVLNSQITFTNTGKISGAIFWVYLLEKLRVTGCKNSLNGNFHMLYYFYDGIQSENALKDYNLKNGYNYQYLIRREDGNYVNSINSEKSNAKKFKELTDILINKLEFETAHFEMIKKILAAIILLGEVKFSIDTEIENNEIVSELATLLSVDEKKLRWSLCNYCVVHKGVAVQKTHTHSEAEEAKHVFARGLYSRLVDFVVNMINLKFFVSRVLMGDFHYISVVDIPGFETFEKNNLEQLFINIVNEQMQYFYTQKIFSLELKELEEEEVVLPSVQYYDNKPTIDELIGSPDGLLFVIDEASHTKSGHSFIIETLANCRKGTRVRKSSSTNFTVAHYVKKVQYNAKEMPNKNLDFLPPELIEVMALSSNPIVKQMFKNAFTKAGNLTLSAETNDMLFTGKRKKWESALFSGDQKSRRINTELYGDYPQARRMRTLAQIFRASGLELLKQINENPDSSNIHFIRCVRANLNNSTDFDSDVVNVQLRSLAVTDTVKNRQKGYSYRVSFQDFILRYKFLAFDFDEEVDITRENCRLLLIRLKLEGWIIGKNKVFLRYYDKEYLSRLYETHVRKITKIQAMMRTFITKRKVIPRIQSQQKQTKNQMERSKKYETKKFTKPKMSTDSKFSMDEESAALLIQKEFRDFQIRKGAGKINNTGTFGCSSTNNLAKIYSKKWRARTLFQVLLAYRAHRFQEMTNFSQQIHLYNQHMASWTLKNKQQEFVSNDSIEEVTTLEKFIGRPAPIIFRLPFTLNHRSLYNSSSMFDPFASKGTLFGENENWDSLIKSLKNPTTREYCIAKHIVTVSDRAIQTDTGSQDTSVTTATELNNDKEFKNNTFKLWLKFLYSKKKNNVQRKSVKDKTVKEYDDPERIANKKKPKVGKALSQCSETTLIAHEDADESDLYEPLHVVQPTTATDNTYENLNDAKKVITVEINHSEPAQQKHDQNITKNNEKPTEPVDVTKQQAKIQAKPSATKERCKNQNQVKFNDKDCAEKTVEKDCRQTDTILEMKIKGRKNVEISPENINECEPPYNFQALLRKTETKEKLLNGYADEKRKIRSQQIQDENEEQYDKSIYMKRKSSLITAFNNKDYVVSELSPGVVVEGEICNL